jgi:GTP-dependent phosphoenolpyruvate carboxykinase
MFGMRRRDFIPLLGGAADWMAGVVRPQLSTGGNVTAKRLDQKLSAGYHARLNVRILRWRDVGSGAEC